jgi:hypothetical protein
MYSSTMALESKWCRLGRAPEVRRETWGREDQIRWATPVSLAASVRFLPMLGLADDMVWELLMCTLLNFVFEGAFLPVVRHAKDCITSLNRFGNRVFAV